MGVDLPSARRERRSGRDAARRGVRAAAGSLRQEGSLRERAAGGCEWTRAAPERRPHAAAHQPGQPSEKPRRLSGKTPEARLPAEAVARSANAFDLVIANQAYTIFLVPCCPAVASDKSERGWLVAGLVSKSSLRTASLSVSFSIDGAAHRTAAARGLQLAVRQVDADRQAAARPVPRCRADGVLHHLRRRADHDYRARYLRIREAEGRPRRPARRLCSDRSPPTSRPS